MSGFRPRRDVDLFLDRENKRFGKGFLQGAHMLKQLLERDSMMHGSPSRHQAQIDMLEGLMWDFRDWLGESKYMYGLTTLPPSRFSDSNSNGLWEYSPFLCGVGTSRKSRACLPFRPDALGPGARANAPNSLAQHASTEEISRAAYWAVCFFRGHLPGSLLRRRPPPYLELLPGPQQPNWQDGYSLRTAPTSSHAQGDTQHYTRRARRGREPFLPHQVQSSVIPRIWMEPRPYPRWRPRQADPAVQFPLPALRCRALRTRQGQNPDL